MNLVLLKWIILEINVGTWKKNNRKKGRNMENKKRDKTKVKSNKISS